MTAAATTTTTLTENDDGRPAMRRRFVFPLVAAAYFALLMIALFGVDLLWHPRAVVSAAEMDIDRQFYSWRDFAFSEWRATGRPPLWNPYAFGGVPALGNVQYALLYPPNWLHLILPTTWAINLVAALHVWLAGVLAAAWCRGRGGSILGSLISGTIFQLSGPVLLHLYAGHLTYLCVVAWSPAVLLAVDWLLDGRGRAAPGVLFGAIAVAMQILGGYPQPAFYTALAVIVYAAARMIAARSGIVRAIACVGLMYVLGATIAAAQLLPAMDAARESVRAAPSGFLFASSYSLPPANLLTAIVPYPFGDDFNRPYTGEWLMWEMSLYVGGVAVMLALCALISPQRRRHVPLAIVLVLAILLALGEHTPVFRVMYEIVPGFDRFRAPARFAFIAALMICALAAAGFDSISGLAQQGGLARIPRHVIAGIAGVIAAALLISSFRGAAIIFAQLALVVLLIGRWRRIAYIIPLLVLFEMWRPAARTIEWFRPRVPPISAASIATDERIVTTTERFLNVTTRLRIEDAWGYDPATAARWTDLVGPLLGADARRGDFAPRRDVRETIDSPIWTMLRVRHVLPTTTQPLVAPRVMLLGNAQVVDGPAASLAAVSDGKFDLRKKVILESPPDPAPSADAGDPGVAHVVARTTDSLTIDAETTRSAVLLITDAYSAGWRANPPYRILPANHALRAIALGAGRHHIVMEYRPPSAQVGMIVTIAALIATAVSGGIELTLLRRRRNLSARPE